VILLQYVVQILNRPMTAALSQDSFFFGFMHEALLDSIWLGPC
jgi:Mg2+/citrate symporter